MPIIKKESEQSSIEKILQDLIQNHDLNNLQKASNKIFFNKDLSGNLNNEEINEVLTFEEAKEMFFKSDRYISLSESSKKTYKSEMKILEKNYVEGLESGVKTHFEDLFTDSKYNTEVLRYLNEDIKENTKQKKKAFLRSFIQSVTYDFYAKHKEVFSSLLKIKTDINSLPKYLELEQIYEVLNLSRQSLAALRNYTILKVLLGSGIRINELTLLQIGDINANTQTIMVFPKGNKKSKKPRKISSEALNVLENYIEFTYSAFKGKENYSELYIFSSNEGQTPLTERTIQYMVKNLILKAESIPKERKEDLSTHSFRHSFAVHALHSGIDIYTISTLLGHKNISSTEIYLNLFDEDLKKAIEKHPFANLHVKNLNLRPASKSQ